MKYAVEVKDLIKDYSKEVRALDGATLKIPEGKVYGLIGPNGSGKTTMIKILAGLLAPTAGEVLVEGLNPQKEKRELHKLIGYMPQETALYNELTVKENLELFGRLYNIPRKELTDRINDLLGFVDLVKRSSTIVANLSGGMKHRASLAAALLPKPKLLILDEPTVGVDPELRATFWARFAEMQADGTTILITTHYMDEASRCEEVALINQGKIISQGAPKEIIQKTKSENLEEAFLKLTRKGGDK